jgi:hypothetical protein
MSIEDEIADEFNDLSSIDNINILMDLLHRRKDNLSQFQFKKKDPSKYDTVVSVGNQECKRCTQEKPLSEFRQRLSGRVNKRWYHVKLCRTCEIEIGMYYYNRKKDAAEFKKLNRERVAQYAKTHPEKIKEYSKKYRSTEKYKAHRREYMKQYNKS